MSEELNQEPKQEVEETTAETSSSQEINETTTLSEEPKTPESDSHIDYKSELEREKERRLKAEKKIEKLKRAEFQPEPDVDDLEERVAQKAAALLKEEQATWQRERNKEIIDEALLSIATSADERELIKFHYENTIRQSGFSRQAVLDDLQAAKLLANRRKYEMENSALKETLKAKSTTETAPAFSGQKLKSNSKPLNDEQKKLNNWVKKYTGGKDIFK